MSEKQNEAARGSTMSDEEREAAVRKLQELRQMQQAQKMQQAQHVQPAPVAPAPKIGYGYAGDEYGEGGVHDADEEYWAEEGFLNYVEANLIHSEKAVKSGDIGRGPTSYALSESDMKDVGERVEMPTSHVRRGLSDFEVLKMAKMGDVESMTTLATMMEVSIVDFTDNHGRNVLHYAADSGDIGALGVLAGRCVPYLTDEKGMTPLDVAVLAGHKEDVLSLIACIAGDAVQQQPRALEEALNKFAIEPPKFVMSKPAPAPPTVTRPRAFWGCDRPTSATSSLVASCISEGKVSAASVERDVLGAVAGLMAGGGSAFSEWLKALEAHPAAAQAPRYVVATVATGGAGTAPPQSVGVAVALSLGGTLQGSPTALAKVKSGRVAVAGCMAVAAPQRGKGVVAPALMTALAAELKDAGNDTVFFASPVLLPRPPTAVAMVKWFRRVLQASEVLRAAHAHHVLPDFFDYDEVLRADCALKGSVPHSLTERYMEALLPWCEVDASDVAGLQLLLEFLQSRSVRESGAELQYVPGNVEDLQMGLMADGLKAFAYVEDGRPTNLAVYRMRELREGGGDGAAQVVFTSFTTIAGSSKADHLLLIASMLLKAQVLYVPGMCGFTDSDLVKANFEEVPTYRHFLYACSTAEPSAAAPLIPPMPASKVAVPVFLV